MSMYVLVTLLSLGVRRVLYKKKDRRWYDYAGSVALALLFVWLIRNVLHINV